MFCELFIYRSFKGYCLVLKTLQTAVLYNNGVLPISLYFQDIKQMVTPFPRYWCGYSTMLQMLSKFKIY